MNTMNIASAVTIINNSSELICANYSANVVISIYNSCKATFVYVTTVCCSNSAKSNLFSSWYDISFYIEVSDHSSFLYISKKTYVRHTLIDIKGADSMTCTVKNAAEGWYANKVCSEKRNIICKRDLLIN